MVKKIFSLLKSRLVIDRKCFSFFLMAVLFSMTSCQTFHRTDKSKSPDHFKQKPYNEVKLQPNPVDSKGATSSDVNSGSIEGLPNSGSANTGSVNTSTIDSTEVPTGTGVASPQTIPMVRKNAPKFAIILSGGGAKAWAHLGVLKEIQKMRFPVVSIAGIEWGSIIAASFAHDLSVNEVEWELSKFKEQRDWEDFVKAVFAKKSTIDFKIPFVCPSINLRTKTMYLLNRGQLDQLIPYCLPSAGLIKPYEQSTAAMYDVVSIAQHLKATGASKILLINVIPNKSDEVYFKGIESVENQIWAMAASNLSRKTPLIDETIEIDLNDIRIDDFDKRRDIMVRGSDLAYPQIKKIADKYRL